MGTYLIHNLSIIKKNTNIEAEKTSRKPLSVNIVFTLLFFCIYSKIILFQHNIFSISDIIHVVYYSKIVPALFLSSMVFITKNKKWTIMLLALIDIWAISNLIYFKANGTLLNVECILMAGNMRGFWSSILAFIDFSLLPYIITTIIYAIVIIHFGYKRERKLTPFIVYISFSALTQFLDLEYRREIAAFHSIGRQKEIKEKYGNYSIFFRDVKYKTEVCGSQGIDDYVKKNTLIHYFPAQFVCFRYQKHSVNTRIDFSHTDSLAIENRIKLPKIKPDSKESLILILVESLESWAIDFTDINGILVAPTLNKLAKNASLYCDKCKSQAKRGTSGDGQLIINTGVLPTQSNAACMVYGNNTYPNIAQYFKSSFTINPCPFVWNQPIVNPHYGYKNLIEKDNSDGITDNDVFDMALKTLDTCSIPTCMQIITISMHVPFNRVKTTGNLEFYEDMPKDIKKYLHCLHYTDSCLNVFLKELNKKTKYSSATIVITGDHIVFKPIVLQAYKSTIDKLNLEIPTNESFCPLLIQSSKLESHITRSDTCYQMDIFPTMLHAMDLDSSYWKGFGINLLDTSSKRTIFEDSAYYISNKIIIDNYFEGMSISQDM